jgi:hypothetical protein
MRRWKRWRSRSSILADDARRVDKAAAMTETFGQFGDFLNASDDEITDDEGPVVGDLVDLPTPLPEKVRQFTAAMIEANPSLTEEQALFYLPHSPHSRKLAERMNDLSKRGDPLPPTTDVFKLSNIQTVVEIAKYIIAKGTEGAIDFSEFDFTKMLQGDARLSKRDKESDGAAFERILTAPTPEGVACGRPIRLRSTAFTAHPPNLPPRSLMTLDYARTKPHL